MRIALVSQEYPPETAHGGIATQTHRKAHGLAALGHEVQVISHSTDDRRHESRDGAVRVTRIPGFDHRLAITTEPVRWLTYSALVASEIAELHRRSPLDLVDVPDWGGEGYVHLLNRTEDTRVPTVAHVHGPLAMFAHAMGWPDLDSDLYRVGTEMEGTSLRMADAVMASSRCSAGWVADRYGLPLERIPVLHAGVDTALLAPTGEPKHDRPTIVSVGRITPAKGSEVLLAAALELAGEVPDLRLRVIGPSDPGVGERLRRRAEAAGRPDLLDLPGLVDRAGLPAELSRAHVFAAPSLYEGGPGFALLEAMAAGLPVVATGGSGLAESVQRGETGLLVPPGDASALAEALRALLGDRSRRVAMGARARAWVVENADTRTCVRRIASVYEAVAAGRAPVEVAVGTAGP